MSTQTDQPFDISENVKTILRIVFTASTELKASLAITCFVFILLMVGITTNGWHTWENGNAGLWSTCIKTSNSTCCTRIKNAIPASVPGN